MAKKCTKIYNERAQLLLYSINLLFGDVFGAVAVTVCLSSLHMHSGVNYALSLKIRIIVKY